MAVTRPGEPAGSPHVAGDEALVRGITFWPATMLVVGNVVGSAVFLTTGGMVEALPSAPLVLAAWLAGGLMTCAGGLTLAEMGAMLPRSGGMYVFLEEAYGPFVAFLFGWAMTLVILPGSIAAVAVGFAASFSYFAPASSTTHVLATIPLPFGALAISAGQVVAAASIAALTVVNLLSVTTTSRLAAVVTFLKVAAIVVIPVAALVVWPQTPALDPVVPPVARPLATFGVVMIAVMWAYDGWSYLAFAAGEVHDPARTLPRAFIFGTLGADRALCPHQRRLLRCASAAGAQRRARVAEKAMTAVMGPSGAMLVAAIVCLSTLGCNLSGLLSGSRMGYGMAIDGMFFRFAALVHPASRTPYGALLGLAAWSCALTISGSYEQLFTYVIFAAVLFNVLGGFAIFRLRRTHASVRRPYRTWGYPFVPHPLRAGIPGTRRQHAPRASGGVDGGPAADGSGGAGVCVLAQAEDRRQRSRRSAMRADAASDGRLDGSMRIAVIGAGAVGGYYGGMLARAGHDVSVIARGAHLAAIRESGLTVRATVGRFTVHPRAADDPGAIGPVDLILFAVKTYDNDTALPLLRPLAAASTIVLTLQNGVDSPADVASDRRPCVRARRRRLYRYRDRRRRASSSRREHTTASCSARHSIRQPRSRRVRPWCRTRSRRPASTDAVPDARVPLWEKCVYPKRHVDGVDVREARPCELDAALE